MTLIVGKTHSEILAMSQNKRTRWYKTISPEEKEEAMRMMEKVRRAKISAARTGRKSPMYGKTQTKEAKAKTRAWWTPERRSKQRVHMTGNILSEVSKAKISVIKTEHWKDPDYRDNLSGENGSNWQGGKSFEPYGVEFNAELKRQIRNRDGHACQECQQTEEQLGHTLDVHHIDYDKRNNTSENLISLCRSCHAQTNFGREDWTEYFSKIMEN